MYDFYSCMVFLPGKAFWVYFSGALLAVAGIALCFDSVQNVAAKVIAATLILIVPAYVACVILPRPRQVVFGGSVVAAIVRLPFQAFFVAWALWFTKPAT